MKPRIYYKNGLNFALKKPQSFQRQYRNKSFYKKANNR